LVLDYNRNGSRLPWILMDFRINVLGCRVIIHPFAHWMGAQIREFGTNAITHKVCTVLIKNFHKLCKLHNDQQLVVEKLDIVHWKHLVAYKMVASDERFGHQREAQNKTCQLHTQKTGSVRGAFHFRINIHAAFCWYSFSILALPFFWLYNSPMNPGEKGQPKIVVKSFIN
jgi:hypothetical protein